MSYSDIDYVRFDPFEGDRDVDIRARRVSVVTTSKEHRCGGLSFDDSHLIPVGTRARFETAVVDGRWEWCWMCLSCINKWFKDIGR